MKLYSEVHGFSLMELMIVIAIIGILTIIAIPSYQNYAKKARFAEVISTASTFKTAIALALQQGEPMDALSCGQYGIPPDPPSTKNLASLKVEKGTIIATSTELAGKVTYILTPNEDGSLWTVNGSCLQIGLCTL